MPVTEKEALAGLKLLVAVAKADGALSYEEKSILEEALKGAKFAGGATSQSLIEGDYDVDALVREVASQEARDATFGACIAMAYANRECLPQEQAILDKIEKAWSVPKDKKGLLGRVFKEARDTVWFTPIEATADPRRRTAEVNEDVLKYSILSGVLGLNPIPLVSIATDLTVVALQAKMFRDIGQHWGRETSKENVKQVIAGLGVGSGARIAVNNLVKFVPGVGSFFAASTNFASTWALGQVANQYWESGGKADLKMLGDIFRKSQADGHKAYEQHKAEVAAKQRAHKALLDELATEYRAGTITLADYERKVVELK